MDEVFIGGYIGGMRGLVLRVVEVLDRCWVWGRMQVRFGKGRLRVRDRFWVWRGVMGRFLVVEIGGWEIGFARESG